MSLLAIVDECWDALGPTVEANSWFIETAWWQPSWVLLATWEHCHLSVGWGEELSPAGGRMALESCCS
jgi:hypothetical protein